MVDTRQWQCSGVSDGNVSGSQSWAWIRGVSDEGAWDSMWLD
jgi:hypothetical protein